MKIFRQLFISISIIIFTCNAFSATDLKDCPSVARVSNVIFTSAIKFGTGWRLGHKIGYWSINFIANLSEAKTPVEALRLGQKYYNTKVNLSSPTDSTDGLCIYAVTDEYTVFTSHFS